MATETCLQRLRGKEFDPQFIGDNISIKNADVIDWVSEDGLATGKRYTGLRNDGETYEIVFQTNLLKETEEKKI